MMDQKEAKTSEEFFSKYNRLISESIDRWHVPGVSIAVVKGDFTFSKGYGIARFPDEKVTPQKLFNAASMTKAFVASAVSLLVDDEGLPDVQWTAPVSKLIGDDFVLSDSRYTELVTVEDILSHRTGLPDSDNACLGIHSKNPDTPKSVTRKLRYLPLTYPLRTKFQYCNVMFVVAVHLLETITGIWIGDYLRHRIWEPLKMKDTYFGLDDLKVHGHIDELAKGYRWDEETCSYAEVPWPVQPEGAGAGEMKSTVLDYALFLRSMIRKTGPISALGHEELVKPRTITGDNPRPFHSPTLYALGWEIETYHGETVVGHDGSTNGFSGKMLYLPRLDWGVVLFANSMDSFPAHEQILWTMIDDLLDVPATKRLDWDGFAKQEEEERDCPTKEELYPKLPDTPIPLALPLSSYTGTYHDNGYGTLLVEYKDEKLEIDCTDRSWRFMLSFEHASGESFIAHLLDTETQAKDVLRAQFRLDADGLVTQLGIDFVEETTWFQKSLSNPSHDKDTAR